jgi:hypothetical protein
MPIVNGVYVQSEGVFVIQVGRGQRVVAAYKSRQGALDAIHVSHAGQHPFQPAPGWSAYITRCANCDAQITETSLNP